MEMLKSPSNSVVTPISDCSNSFVAASDTNRNLTFEKEPNMAKKTSKTVVATEAELQFNMATVAEIDVSSNDDAILASMFDDIEEEVEIDDPVEDEIIEAVSSDLDKAESIEKLYDEQDGKTTTVAVGDTPKTDETVAATVTKKAKAPKAPKEPKAPRVTRIGNNESVVLAAKLGDKVGEFLILEVGDAALEEEALKAKQAEVLASIDELAKKVGEKATILFSWMKNGGKLNEVLQRTFSVLARDGELTSGNKGNLQTDLLSKPYSPGTSASQANQMFMLLPALKVTIKEKGRMIPNPDSMIYMKAKAELGLA